MSASACQCEGCRSRAAVTNPPGLDAISYRVCDFADVRRALLASLGGELGLAGWRPAPGDLGLQMLEWWAYLADILTFYNERIANEDYLRTAQLPASVTGLVALLGYRPRPAIAAVGEVAAIRSAARPQEALVIPAGLQLANSASPGVPVQTFETAAAEFSGSSDTQIMLEPGTRLLDPMANTADPTLVGAVLLAGTVTSLKQGDELLAVVRSFPAAPLWAKLSVVSTAVEADPNGGKNTRVVLDAPLLPRLHGWMSTATAHGTRLLRSGQTAALWSQTTLTNGSISRTSATSIDVQLAAAVRGIAPGDLVFLDSSQGSAVGVVTAATEVFDAVPNPSQEAVTSAADGVAKAVENAAKVGGATPGQAQVAGAAAVTAVHATIAPRIPVLHTRLSLQTPYPDWAVAHLNQAGDVAVRFGLTAVGTLVGAPPTTLDSLPATVSVPPGFGELPGGTPAFVEDLTGAGIPVVVASSSPGSLVLEGTAAGGVPQTPPEPFGLRAPLRLLVDLIPVSRGTTVPGEALGIGDASIAGQVFTLKKSPLTYLSLGAGEASTLQIAVDGIYWTEARTFYGQPATAHIFVVSQLPNGTSQVRFGDGTNGARLPTGGHVVATYRYGAGAASPPAGRLTTILKPQPNLASVRNPVAVWGGDDGDQPADIRRNAPASVLTFGRAISADDYETVAARAAGVKRARSYWTWDEGQQRALVKVYVGDDEGARDSATSALTGAEDPNRPIVVARATAVPLTLRCTLRIAADRVADDVVAAAEAELADDATGLFSAARMTIGRPLYVSQIESALLVPGAVAVHALAVTSGGVGMFEGTNADRAEPGEGAFYTLESSTITPVPGNG